MSYKALYKEMMESPCTRFTLQRALKEFENMDPVDALHDAETLVYYLKMKWDQVLKDGLAELDSKGL